MAREVVNRTRPALLLAALLLAPCPGHAQEPAPAPPRAPEPAKPRKQEKVPKWRIDPFTKNAPAALQAAGYLSYGPFPFGSLAGKPVSTARIDEALGRHVEMLWLETKHFRIGVDLPPFTVPMDPETRGKIRRELEQLQAKLPSVDPKAKVLTPWLRAHLVAQRLENLHAEVSALFGVKDEDFPADPSKVVRLPDVRYMGQGPHFGMKEKFLVLLFEKMGPFQQYTKDFLGRDTLFGQRWHFTEVGALLFTIAGECDDGRNKDDTALHCALAFNVGQNLLDGFRHYSYELPVWITEGFSHWLCRRVDPHWPNFDQNEGSIADMKKVWRWEPYVRNLVASGGRFAPFPEAYAWRDFGDITFNDHVAIWSRIDWLLSMGPDKWQKFLFLVKGRVDEQWLPDQSDLVGAVRDALQQAYGIPVLDFDRRWGEWVKATYPTQ